MQEIYIVDTYSIGKFKVDVIYSNDYEGYLYGVYRSGQGDYIKYATSYENALLLIDKLGGGLN